MAKKFARWVGARGSGRWCARVTVLPAVLALLGVVAGCGETPEAGTLEPGDDRGSVTRTAGEEPTGEASGPSTGDPTDDRTDGPTGEATEESTGPDGSDGQSPKEEPALNVCELVPAKRVRAIFGRDETPTMDDPEEVAPGVPGVGTVYRCTYRWEPGETTQFVTIAAMTDTGEADPGSYIANVLGDGFQSVGGFGDAAGVIRGARFGNGIGAFASARSTLDGVAGVFIQGPQETGDGQFGRLSAEFFSALETHTEEQSG